MGSNKEPQDMKKRRLALINVLRSLQNPFVKISPVHAIALTLALIRFTNVYWNCKVLGHSEYSTNAMLFPIKTHRCLGDTWGQKYKNLENQRKKSKKKDFNIKEWEHWHLGRWHPPPSAERRRWQCVSPSPVRTTQPHPDMQCRVFILRWADSCRPQP